LEKAIFFDNRCFLHYYFVMEKEKRNATVAASTLPPYLTASTAARELGYTSSVYLRILCNGGKIAGAYRDGKTWLIPREWVAARQQQDAAQGIVRGVRPGRPVTTGAGLNRKRPQYTPKKNKN
jgi:neutral trehalase